MMQMKIEDLLVENMVNARDFLLNFFGVTLQDGRADLVQYAKLLAALRGMPPQGLADVCEPLLERMFAELGFDPKNAKERAEAAAFVDMFALAVQDATQIIMNNVEMNQRRAAQNEAALRQGKAQLIT